MQMPPWFRLVQHQLQLPHQQPAAQLPHSPCVPTPLSSPPLRQMHANAIRTAPCCLLSLSPHLFLFMSHSAGSACRGALAALPSPLAPSHPPSPRIDWQARAPAPLLCTAPRAPLSTHRLCCCAEWWQRQPARPPCPPVLFPAVYLPSPVTTPLCLPPSSAVRQRARWRAGGRLSCLAHTTRPNAHL